jgi:hypothetical protein
VEEEDGRQRLERNKAEKSMPCDGRDTVVHYSAVNSPSVHKACNETKGEKFRRRSRCKPGAPR